MLRGKEAARGVRGRRAARAVGASVRWSSARGTADLFEDKNGREPGSGGLSSMKQIADGGQIGVCAHFNTKEQVVQRSFHRWSVKERGGWQRSTLTRGRPRTTIDAGGLYCRVRDGTGCFPTALATNSSLLTQVVRCERSVTCMLRAALCVMQSGWRRRYAVALRRCRHAVCHATRLAH